MRACQLQVVLCLRSAAARLISRRYEPQRGQLLARGLPPLHALIAARLPPLGHEVRHLWGLGGGRQAAQVGGGCWGSGGHRTQGRKTPTLTSHSFLAAESACRGASGCQGSSGTSSIEWISQLLLLI